MINHRPPLQVAKALPLVKYSSPDLANHQLPAGWKGEATGLVASLGARPQLLVGMIRHGWAVGRHGAWLQAQKQRSNRCWSRWHRR